MDVTKLLDRLAKVKSTGRDKWIACCPAHQDKTPSLSIRLADDRILLHCFGGGCGAADVIAAVGLDFADLFPPRPAAGVEYRPRVHQPFSAGDALRCLAAESGIIAIAIADLAEGRKLNETDAQRVNIASGRITAAMGYVYG